MQLSYILLENVEKLIPHLYSMLEKSGKHFHNYGGADSKQKAIMKIIDLTLQCDPVYVRDKEKGKPDSHCKSPFVKTIIKWWIHDDIVLPEDIQTTREVLVKFALAKQKGLNKNIADFATYDQFLEAMEPFLESDEVDNYEQLGFRKIYDRSPFKIYVIDHWVDGPASTLHTGQIQHVALAGTQWCVKYKHNFNTLYKLPHYMVTKRNRRYALINFDSRQCKNVKDRPFYDPDLTPVIQFLLQIPAAYADFSSRCVRALTNNNSNILGDFTEYQQHTPLINLESDDILNIVIHNPDLIDNYWKYLLSKQSEKLPEIYHKLEDSVSKSRNASIIIKWVQNARKARWPEMESRLITATDRIMYYKALITNGVQNIQDVVNRIEDMLLEEGNPHKLIMWIKFSHRGPWPDAEPIIATNEKERARYKILVNKDIHFEQTDIPESLCMYAISNGIQLPPDKEAIVLRDIRSAIKYAAGVTGPWPELQDIILANEDNPDFQEIVHLYETNVLFGPFYRARQLLGEPVTQEQLDSQ